LDFDPTGRLAVYDAATGRQVKILTTSLDPNGLEPVSSDDDHWLAGVTAPSRHVARILIWQLTDLNAPPLSFPIHESPQSLAINSRSVAVENLDGSVDVRALPSLQLIGRVPPEPTQVPPNSGFVAVSADGRLVVRGNPGDDRRCTIYGVGPGAPAPVVLPSQPQTLFVAAMSPDAKRVALGSASGSVAVYDTATGGLDEALSGHAGPVTAVRWTGTGLYTIGLDSQIISWTVSAGSRLIRFSGPDLRTPDRGEVFGRYVLGLSPRFGAVPSSQEKLLLANLDRGSVTQWPAKLKDGPSDNFTGEYVNQAVASFDGKRALVSVNDQTGLNHIDIWDLVRHQRIGMLHLPGSFYRHFIIGLVAAISPDGSTAYAAIDRDHIGVFTLPSGRMTRSFALGFTGPNADRVVDIPWQFDPSGRLLVYGYDTGPYRKGIPTTFPTSRAGPINHRWGLLDVKTGKWLARVSYGDSTVDNIAWSPDGRLLAIGTYEGTLTTYDAATLRVRSAAGPVEPGFVQSVSFSPDGRTIVTGGTAGSLSFFDAADLSREGTPLPIGVGANNGGVFAWFDRRGNVVGLGNDPAQPGTTLHRWFTFAAEPSSLVRTACDLAGTDITRAQWQRYVGDRPYRSVCPHSS
jgi:WD40 repeat protein